MEARVVLSDSTSEGPKVEVARLDFNNWKFNKLNFVRQLGDTLASTGFCILRNSGVEQGTIDQAFAMARAVFALPTADKRAYAKADIFFQRGYVPFGTEKYPNQPADHKEMWHAGLESEFPNVWPTQVPSFEGAMKQLSAELYTCAEPLLRACALYLGEPEMRLAEMAQNGRSLLRAAFYPPKNDARATILGDGSKWAGAHTDINFLTLLCPATESGLQVQTRSGVWVPVNASQGEIIVNVADMLENLTNGVFVSGLHQVANPNDPLVERLAMPYFLHPRADVDLSPLASCISRIGTRDPKYRKLTAQAYLAERLKEISLA